MAKPTAAAGIAGEIPPVDDPVAGMTEPLAIRMDKRFDVAFSAAVVLAGALICYLASGFRPGSFPDPVTSRGLPYFGGGFMIFAGLFNIVRRLTTWSLLPGNLVPSEGTDDEAGHPASAVRSFGIAALAFLWVLVFRDVGYLLLQPLIMIAMLWLMEVRSPWKLIGFPMAFTALIWVTFSQVLSIVIPLGPLTAPFRSWGLVP